jgi:hypothetical protein
MKTQNSFVLVKLVFSKKTTKIDEIFTVDYIMSIFVAFLENMNFTYRV